MKAKIYKITNIITGDVFFEFSDDVSCILFEFGTDIFLSLCDRLDSGVYSVDVLKIKIDEKTLRENVIGKIYKILS